MKSISRLSWIYLCNIKKIKCLWKTVCGSFRLQYLARARSATNAISWVVMVTVVWFGDGLIESVAVAAQPSSEVAASPFSRVLPGQPLKFPEDHLLHPDFQSEWWYVTANLQDEQGRDYGVQFTLFAAADLTGGVKQRIFFAHAALSSATDFFFAERYARADMGHAGVQANPWLAFIDNWRMEGGAVAPLPGRIVVEEESFGYQLMTSDADYFLQGDEGFSKKNESGSMASYYYSAPFIEVNGTVTMAGETRTVSGRAWLDREWSTRVIRAEDLGWDWFALRLNDQTALMLYRLRSHGEQHFYSSIMSANGTIEVLGASEVMLEAGQSQSFEGRDYVLDWRIRIPSRNIDIHTRPINDSQFLRTRISYWEGAVKISGSHESVGYMELFGAR